MQATTFRLGALVALVGALPALLDDASDIARLTIKKHKKHHSLEPSMHDEAFDVTMERRRVDCAEDKDCCSIDLQAEFGDVLKNSGEEMCWGIQLRPDKSNRRGPLRNYNVGHVEVPGRHACEHFAFLHKGSWAHCQESGSDGTPCTYKSTGWFAYPGISKHGIGGRHAYCPKGLRRKVSFQLTPEQEAREAARAADPIEKLRVMQRKLKAEVRELGEEFNRARLRASPRLKEIKEKYQARQVDHRKLQVRVCPRTRARLRARLSPHPSNGLQGMILEEETRRGRGERGKILPRPEAQEEDEEDEGDEEDEEEADEEA